MPYASISLEAWAGWFPKFKDLPFELQRMIWSFALDETPNIIQAVYIPRELQYKCWGPSGYILRNQINPCPNNNYYKKTLERMSLWAERNSISPSECC